MKLKKRPRDEYLGQEEKSVEQVASKPPKRNGWLKNGNPTGDFSAVTRCGAKTRHGTACKCPAMTNGRCRLHGGLSTGPKTAEGIERIRRALTKHGRYAATAEAERRYLRKLLEECRTTLRTVRGRAQP
jgi:hypothetical protein